MKFSVLTFNLRDVKTDVDPEKGWGISGDAVIITLIIQNWANELPRWSGTSCSHRKEVNCLVVPCLAHTSSPHKKAFMKCSVIITIMFGE